MLKHHRILLADDHAIVLEGLRRVLEPHFEIVGEVADGRALVSAAEMLKPDIIVADISMPLLNGIDAARQIRKFDRQVKIIFLTMHPDVTYASEALLAGGSAYVLKISAGADLLEAIHEVDDGRTYVTPSIRGSMVHAQPERGGGRENAQIQLTPRQREVLQLLAEGKSLKEAAAVLNISIRTAEFHKYQIMKLLGLRTNAELTKYAIKLGITPL
jgi:DNA-binding NarL/FixJ family response regulator